MICMELVILGAVFIYGLFYVLMDLAFSLGKLIIRKFRDHA